jgi:hypothetical protein
MRRKPLIEYRWDGMRRQTFYSFDKWTPKHLWREDVRFKQAPRNHHELEERRIDLYQQMNRHVKAGLRPCDFVPRRIVPVQDTSDMMSHPMFGMF